jgi:hypothetical protein
VWDLMTCHDGPWNAVAQTDILVARTHGAECTAGKERQNGEAA